MQDTSDIQNIWRDADFGIIPAMALGKGKFAKREESDDGTISSEKTPTKMKRM